MTGTMEMEERRLELEAEIVKVLRGIFDPEIPVNIYDLGLIYEIEVEEDGKVTLVMTLTAPNCPMADSLLGEVNEKIREIRDVTDLNLKLVFDPPWNKDMLSDEARLELGLM